MSLGSNVYVNGRRVMDGMKCPVCDHMLTPQNMEYELGMPLCTGTGMSMDCRGNTSISLKMICVECSAEVDIYSSCGTIEYNEQIDSRLGYPFEARIESLRLINDIYESDWEYIIMSIASVKYGRVKNLGDYETERFEAEVVLDPGQSREDAAAEAKAFVKNQLGLGPTDVELEAARELLRENGEL